jgi:hypothetical protein
VNRALARNRYFDIMRKDWNEPLIIMATHDRLSAIRSAGPLALMIGAARGVDKQFHFRPPMQAHMPPYTAHKSTGSRWYFTLAFANDDAPDGDQRPSPAKLDA